MPKQTTSRSATQPKKVANKSKVTVNPAGRSWVSRNSITTAAKASAPATKKPTVAAPSKDDMSDLVPSDAILARALRRRKVEMEWYDDGHPDAKPAKPAKK